MNDEVLVKVEGVSKKFCRDLKRSLWYGVKDISTELFGANKTGQLRPKEFWAVDDVSFELKRGECLGLIGHNGAGKSTLLKMLNGLIKPDKGSITMKGRIGALIELGSGFNPILTGRENIYNNGAVLGFSKKEIDAKFDAIVEFAEIGNFLDTPVQNYSSGMKVRLGFAVASQMEPDVLIIDEVLAVGDLGFQTKCYNAIGKLIQKCTVIFVSHSMPHVSRICNQGIIMDKGLTILKSKNIGDVIEKYFSKFSLGEIRESSYGNLKIDTISLKVGDKVYNHGDDINTSQDEEFTIFCELRNKDQKVYYVRVILFSQDFRPILDCNSIESGFYLNGEQFLSFKLDLGKLNLKAGKYSYSLAFTEKDIENTELRMDYVVPFQVKSDIPSWADFRTIGRWEYLNKINI